MPEVFVEKKKKKNVHQQHENVQRQERILKAVPKRANQKTQNLPKNIKETIEQVKNAPKEALEVNPEKIAPQEIKTPKIETKRPEYMSNINGPHENTKKELSEAKGLPKEIKETIEQVKDIPTEALEVNPEKVAPPEIETPKANVNIPKYDEKKFNKELEKSAKAIGDLEVPSTGAGEAILKDLTPPKNMKPPANVEVEPKGRIVEHKPKIKTPEPPGIKVPEIETGKVPQINIDVKLGTEPVEIHGYKSKKSKKK